MNVANLTYNINLNFEEIKLPPFQDILVVAKDSKQGKVGLAKSFELLVPNGFKIIEIDHEKVEVIFVHKNILAKITPDKIIQILNDNVFPYISSGEIIKVDFKVNITVKNIVLKEAL